MGARSRLGGISHFLVAGVLVMGGCAIDPHLADGGRRVAISPDGNLVATFQGDLDKILLRDPLTLVESGELITRPYVGKATKSINSLEFSRDGKRLLAAGIDDTVIVWDVPNHAEIFRRDELTGIRQATISPDGTLVAVAGPGNKASVWRIEDQQKIAQLIGHFDDVTAIAFSNSGNLVATGSVDRTVRLWPLEHFQLLESETLPEWHRSTVTSLAFSRDDTLLAASAGSLKLWRIADRRVIALALSPAPMPQAPLGAEMLTAILMGIASARSGQFGGGPLGAPPIGGITGSSSATVDLMAAFSPDDRLLAVLRRNPSSWHAMEVVVTELGGSQVRVFDCECVAIAFRPDGLAIAITSGDGIRYLSLESPAPVPVSK
jgi:hypothetical protein